MNYLKRFKIVFLKDLAASKNIDLIKEFENFKPINEVEKFWKRLGPGLTTGAADDDPSGIATYSQTGSRYGFQLLWLAGFTFPLMSIIQEMCARIGLVTGRGLAANIKLHYPRIILYLCTTALFLANSLNIGADLGAMAKSTQLLLPNTSFILLVFLFALVIILLEIFMMYEQYAHILKLIALVLAAYIISGLSTGLNLNALVINTLIPQIQFNKDQIILICGILGTTISPYLFFWQTSQEVEEKILEGQTSIRLRQDEANPKEIKNMRIDVWTGMFFSNIVMYFIIATCAQTLHLNGLINITSADEAALALQPIAGPYTFILFSVGIIGTGLLAVPVLAGSASYAISESLGWKYGLYRKLKEARAFYGIIILATLLGTLINIFNIDVIQVLVLSAIINGIISAPILALIVLISSNKKIMGKYVNSIVYRLIGWFIVVLIALTSILSIYFLIK
jgi:NRAMP (natural resistance-associated macrophage protein)-like metal ion transporter